MDGEKKYAPMEVINEIGHSFTQMMMERPFFSIIRQMQHEKEEGLHYPDRVSYPVTIGAFKVALDNVYCRYLIHELVARGYKDTMALWVSYDYLEYHVIAQGERDKAFCIVKHNNDYDHLCDTEWVDMGTLKTYERREPVSLRELAQRLRIKGIL